MARKTIMVVDDEKGLIELVKGILEHENFKVIAANSGEDCLNKLKKVKPDLILMDMMMPGMSGTEVCERIRKTPKVRDIKIAFLTVAKYSEIGRETMRRLRIENFIVKPFDNKDLVRKIKKLIE